MAYTVKHLYTKVLEGTDKLGFDLIPLSVVMNRLETATLDFIGETVKFIENNQEIRDDLRTLYKPYKIAVVVDPTDDSYHMIPLPVDYQHLMSAKVMDANVTVRDSAVIRHGQEEIYETDPDTKATAEYPLLFLYDDTLRISSPGTPLFVKGFYLKKPTFGAYKTNAEMEDEIAVNLPEQSVDKIIKTIINEIFVSTGDPRAQTQWQEKENYRKRT